MTSNRCLNGRPDNVTLDEALAATYSHTIQEDVLGGERPCWTASIPEIPGCYGWGITEEEAFEELEVAKGICLRAMAEKGLPLPEPPRVVEVKLVPRAFVSLLTGRLRARLA